MPTPRAASDITRDVLQALLGHATDAIHVCLWDGAYWPDPAPRSAALLLNHPGALRAMFAPGDEVSLGEAYLYDDIDIAGDLEAVYGAVEALVRRPPQRLPDVAGQARPRRQPPAAHAGRLVRLTLAATQR